MRARERDVLVDVAIRLENRLEQNSALGKTLLVECDVGRSNVVLGDENI